MSEILSNLFGRRPVKTVALVSPYFSESPLSDSGVERKPDTLPLMERFCHFCKEKLHPKETYYGNYKNEEVYCCAKMQCQRYFDMKPLRLVLVEGIRELDN